MSWRLRSVKTGTMIVPSGVVLRPVASPPSGRGDGVGVGDLEDGEFAGRVEGVGFGEDGVVQGEFGDVAGGTFQSGEECLASLGGGAGFGMVGHDADGRGQRGLEYDEGADVAAGEFVGHAVGVVVNGVAEALGRLHTEVLVHGLDRELAQGDYGAFLHEGPYHQVGVNALDGACVEGAVGGRGDCSEVDGLGG